MEHTLIAYLLAADRLTFIVDGAAIQVATVDLLWVEPVIATHGVQNTLSALSLILQRDDPKQMKIKLAQSSAEVQAAYELLQTRRSLFEHIESLLLN